MSRPYKDRIHLGDTYGDLTIIADAGRREGRSYLSCRCVCGGVTCVSEQHLLTGHTQSCGCLWGKAVTASLTKHGLTRSPEYTAWGNMKKRCCNPKTWNFDRYGGRGIKVCDRWLHSFENFYADMGPRPEGTTLDRKDNDGDYEPDNCRWATKQEQSRNRRNVVFVYDEGVNKPLYEWFVLAKANGISKSAVRWRLRSGWPIREAVTRSPGS